MREIRPIWRPPTPAGKNIQEKCAANGTDDPVGASHHNETVGPFTSMRRSPGDRGRGNEVTIMPQVRDSGCEGSCVGFAVAAALEDQIRKVRARGVTISPRYIYYYAREQGGFPTDCDTGAHLKDAVAILLQRGAVAERVWPYKAGEFGAKPPEAVERAVHYKISQAQRIHSIDELKAALQEARSVVGGLCLFPSAYTEEVSRTGRIPMPEPDECLRSAAAVCFVGFADTERLLKFRPPWGRRWGDHGYGYISYDYAQRFLSDAWAIAIAVESGVTLHIPHSRRA